MGAHRARTAHRAPATALSVSLPAAAIFRAGRDGLCLAFVVDSFGVAARLTRHTYVRLW